MAGLVQGGGGPGPMDCRRPEAAGLARIGRRAAPEGVAAGTVQPAEEGVA